jgi:hypothetical protein
MKHRYALIFIVIFGCAAPLWAQENPTINAYEFGRGLRFTDRNDNEMRIMGYLQPYAEFRQLLNDENPEDAMRFRMRRIRLRVDGNIGNEKWSYRFQADLSGTGELLDGSSNFLLDAYLSYNFTRRIKLTLGQRAPYSDNRELFMNSNSLQLVERSRVTSAFATIREVGAFLEGNFRLGSSTHYIKPYLMLTNGDGPNVFTKDLGGLKVATRIDYLPFGLFTNLGQFNQADVVRERTPKLVFGGHASYNQGVSSRGGRESGAILYLDADNNLLLPDYYKYGLDLMFKFRGFSMIAEFVRAGAVVPEGITQRVRVDGSVTPDFVVNGQQDVANYILGRMIVGAGYNMQMGYMFKNGYSVDGRFTHLQSDPHSFLNNGTFYNRPYYYTLGVSKYLGRNYGAKLQADVTYVRNNGGINNSAGLPVSGNELIFRVQSTFSF